MALFKRKKRIKTQDEYGVYFYGKKVKGELKSALTLAQWVKAGKPKSKISKPKKRVAPKGKLLKKKKKKKRTLRGTRKVMKRIGSALSEKEKARLRD